MSFTKGFHQGRAVKLSISTKDVEPTNERQFVTEEEKEYWSSKETPEGAKLKAEQTEQKAKDYSIPLTMKGIPGGVAELDSNKKIPLSQLPDLSTNKTYVVKSEVEKDAIDDMDKGE